MQARKAGNASALIAAAGGLACLETTISGMEHLKLGRSDVATMLCLLCSVGIAMAAPLRPSGTAWDVAQFDLHLHTESTCCPFGIVPSRPKHVLLED